MDNFWFCLSNLYLQCILMYLLSLPVSERFEFRRNWDGLGRSIGASCTRPELRFTKNADRATSLYMWEFVVLCRNSTRFYPFAGLFFLFAGTQFVDSNKIFLKIGECLLLDS